MKKIKVISIGGSGLNKGDIVDMYDSVDEARDVTGSNDITLQQIASVWINDDIGVVGCVNYDKFIQVTKLDEFEFVEEVKDEVKYLCNKNLYMDGGNKPMFIKGNVYGLSDDSTDENVELVNEEEHDHTIESWLKHFTKLPTDDEVSEVDVAEYVKMLNNCIEEMQLEIAATVEARDFQQSMSDYLQFMLNQSNNKIKEQTAGILEWEGCVEENLEALNELKVSECPLVTFLKKEDVYDEFKKNLKNYPVVNRDGTETLEELFELEGIHSVIKSFGWARSGCFSKWSEIEDKWSEYYRNL